MNTLNRVLYIGLHPHTLRLLNRAPLVVVGTSLLEFFFRFTINPANLAFQFAYAAHAFSFPRPIQIISGLIWKSVRFCNTGVYERYGEYLSEILRSQIQIINVDDIEELRTFIINSQTELIIINAWGLLPDEVLTLPQKGALNIHPSPLPQYRGALPTLWSLKNGDSESAVTILVTAKEIDGGEILAQHRFAIGSQDSSLDVERAVDEILARHLHADACSYVTGKYSLSPQVGTPTRTDKYEAYRKILWEQEPSRDIVNKTLLYPYLEPFVYCSSILDGKVIFIRSIRNAGLIPQPLSPGEFRVARCNVYVGTIDAILSFRLFRDVSWKDGMRFLFVRHGRFEM